MSIEATRADISADLTRAINNLTAWQRHMRNPAKNPRPKTSLHSTAARLDLTAATVDTLPE